MIKKLILHPTDTSQWHAIVNEAQVATRLILNENTESYLVFLLMRFAQTPELLESVLAFDFLDAMNVPGRQQIDILRGVGIRVYCSVGYFQVWREKKHVKLEYFSDLGQSAYLSISELGDNEQAPLYLELSLQFITMQHVLQAMRGSYFLPFNEPQGVVFPLKNSPIQ